MPDTRFPLSWFLSVDESFDALGVFIEKLEDGVEEIINAQAKLANEEGWGEDDGEERDREQLFRDTLPRTLRYSTILGAHAVIDALLSKLCDHVQKRLKLRFSRSDMAHQWALGSRLQYLRKALGEDLTPGAFDGPFRQKLADFTRV